MPTFADLLADAAAGDSVKRYLEQRQIRTVGTLALLARDEQHLEQVLITPLLSDWLCTDGSRIALTAAEKPIAEAMLRHMWNEARAAWNQHMSMKASAAAGATSSPTSTTTPSSSAPPADDKVPRQFPANVWSRLVSDYQGQQIDNMDRVFPVNELLGAEKIVARLWHEHTISKNYGPIYLGEIVASRTFSASGEPNPLSKKEREKATTLTVTGDKLVSTPEEVWVPRSILSVLDGLQSIRWCLILLKFGSEQAINAFFDWLTRLARSRPQKMEQFSQFWLTVSWRLATEMRSGRSFEDSVAPIMRDYDTFTECMARDLPKQDKKPSSPVKSEAKGGGKTQTKAGKSNRFQPYRSSRPWQHNNADSPSTRPSTWNNDYKQAWSPSSTWGGGDWKQPASK